MQSFPSYEIKFFYEDTLNFDPSYIDVTFVNGLNLALYSHMCTSPLPTESTARRKTPAVTQSRKNPASKLERAFVGSIYDSIKIWVLARTGGVVTHFLQSRPAGSNHSGPIRN